jgi:hypothetical protein
VVGTAASRNSFGGGARWLRLIERDWETEGGLRSIRVPSQFVRWFYRARRGRQRRHYAGDGRDASVAMSSFQAQIHSNRLATDADGLRWTLGWSLPSGLDLIAPTTWSMPMLWRTHARCEVEDDTSWLWLVEEVSGDAANGLVLGPVRELRPTGGVLIFFS